MERFGVRLAKLRRQARMTQEAFAAKAGLHVQTLRDYEQGRQDNPTLRTIESCRIALDVKIETLLSCVELPGGRNDEER